MFCLFLDRSSCFKCCTVAVITAHQPAELCMKLNQNFETDLTQREREIWATGRSARGDGQVWEVISNVFHNVCEFIHHPELCHFHHIKRIEMKSQVWCLETKQKSLQLPTLKGESWHQADLNYAEARSSQYTLGCPLSHDVLFCFPVTN